MSETGYVLIPVRVDARQRPDAESLRHSAVVAAVAAGGVLTDAPPEPCEFTGCPDGFTGLRFEMTR